jgi:Ca2+-transporting ATPase
VTKALHESTPAEVARSGASHLEWGLSEHEAAARLAHSGPNRLARAARPAYLAIALRQFADPLVGLLVAAAVVSFAIGDKVEGAAIGAIVVLNALLGFVQEASAERAVLALRGALHPLAHPRSPSGPPQPVPRRQRPALRRARRRRGLPAGAP